MNPNDPLFTVFAIVIMELRIECAVLQTSQKLRICKDYLHIPWS